MSRCAMRARAGLTIVELLIAMLVAAVIGMALVTLFIGQSRLFGQQESLRSARSVSRTAVNALLAELRMVEAVGGVENPSPTSVTLRVPYAMGVICDISGADLTVSLLPVDSAMYARAGYSGYAWRDANGVYTYVPRDAEIQDLGSGCSSAGITTLTGGRRVQLSPMPGAGAGVGTPILLYRRVRYAFEASAEPDGGIALWRTTLENSEAEELVGPFDADGTRFRFFVDGSATPLENPPADFSQIRGLEFVLEGLGDRPVAPGEPRASAPLTTAVFFKNRPN